MNDSSDPLMVGRKSDGKLVHRPLSPHLQVYRWPVSMMLSIAHRVTGVGLAVGALLMTWWLVAAAASEGAFATVQGFLGSGFGIFLLFCWAAALLLHLFLGIRHLVFDMGWGFGIMAQQEPVRRTQWGFESRVYRSSAFAVIGAAGVVTLIVWIVGMLVR